MPPQTEWFGQPHLKSRERFQFPLKSYVREQKGDCHQRGGKRWMFIYFRSILFGPHGGRIPRSPGPVLASKAVSVCTSRPKQAMNHQKELVVS